MPLFCMPKIKEIKVLEPKVKIISEETKEVEESVEEEHVFESSFAREGSRGSSGPTMSALEHANLEQNVQNVVNAERRSATQERAQEEASARPYETLQTRHQEGRRYTAQQAAQPLQRESIAEQRQEFRGTQGNVGASPRNELVRTDQGVGSESQYELGENKMTGETTNERRRRML